MLTSFTALSLDEIEELQTWSVLSEPEIQYLFSRFSRLDIRGKGHLSYSEIMRVPEFHSNPLFSLILRKVESLGYPRITFPVFLETMERMSPKKDRSERIGFLFSLFDLNNENKLCAHVLNRIGTMVGNRNYLEVLKIYDVGDKGYLNYKEFKKLYVNERIEERMVMNYEEYLEKRESMTFRKFLRLMWGCKE